MKRTSKISDLEVLKDIVLHNKHSDSSYTDSIVIHIRTGDVLHPPHCFDNIQTILEKGVVSTHYNIAIEYCKPFSYYKDELKRTHRNIKKITLISGNHKMMKSSKSLRYLQLLKQRFVDIGYEVEILYNQPPDKDFTVMSLARYFIPSAGGFSLLAKKMNNYIS